MAKGDRRELFNVIEREGLNKPYWQKIGAAFENADGSHTLIFDAFPVGHGRVQMRLPYDEARDGGGGGDPQDPRDAPREQGRQDPGPAPRGGRQGGRQGRR